jgi:3-hydroxybutyrate dehydrogenase
MSGALANHIALVTGSTDGIGLEIARQLAAQGAAVALNGFGDAARIDALCAELGALGARVQYFDADLMQADQAAAPRGQGHTVNGPGRHPCQQRRHPAQGTDRRPAAERWDAVMALNLNAPFHTIRTALPGMRARGWGRIVNIASAYGLAGVWTALAMLRPSTALWA